MKKLTKQEAIEEHRKMWNWIADETLKRKKVVDKKIYFDENDIPLDEIPDHYCYCCEYVKGKNKNGYYFGDCRFSCPFVWAGDETNSCLSAGSEYRKWGSSITKRMWRKTRSKLARAIANLPIREDY